MAILDQHLNSEDNSRDISIWLDGYDDIFSDFDSRGYAERVLSDDFLGEINKVARENNRVIQGLRLLVPDNARNKDNEEIITKRLHGYFRKNFQQLSVARRQSIINYLLLLLFGCAIMVITSYIGMKRSEGMLWSLLFVIFEPCGWFVVWTSLDGLANLPGRRSRMDFYGSLLKTKIIFEGIRNSVTVPTSLKT